MSFRGWKFQKVALHNKYLRTYPNIFNLCENKMCFMNKLLSLLHTHSPLLLRNSTAIPIQQRNFAYQIILWQGLWGTVLTENQCGRAQTTVGDTISRQMGLHCLRKLLNHEPKSKPPNSMPPQFCFGSLLTLLPWF